jgi:hypothetical protein
MFSYDPSLLAGKVRLLIADTVDLGHVFEDDEVAAALSAADDNLNRAAAMLLRALASNKARLSKRLKALDVEVDLKGASAELRALAKDLEESDDESGAFGIVEMVPNVFAARERLAKESQRLS